jgi:hypothetical protein
MNRDSTSRWLRGRPSLCRSGECGTLHSPRRNPPGPGWPRCSLWFASRRRTGSSTIAANAPSGKPRNWSTSHPSGSLWWLLGHSILGWLGGNSVDLRQRRRRKSGPGKDASDVKSKPEQRGPEKPTIHRDRVVKLKAVEKPAWQRTSSVWSPNFGDSTVSRLVVSRTVHRNCFLFTFT